MILTILEHNLPLDEVVYCEVMFDENISGEYPLHADFIHNKAIPILESVYSLKVRVLRDSRTYKGMCTSLRVKGKYVGTPVGFPTRLGPWCKKLKLKPVADYHKEQIEPVHEYVGIAVDEPERLARLTPDKSAPLADYGITEEKALEICRQRHLLSPIYDTFARNGCWFCCNARVAELRDLYRRHPELWAELKEIQTISKVSFTQRHSVFDFEERFANEIVKEAHH